MSDGTGQHYGGLDLLAKMMTPEGLAAVERDQQERAARMWELERTVSRQADEIERLEAKLNAACGAINGNAKNVAAAYAREDRLRAALGESVGARAFNALAAIVADEALYANAPRAEIQAVLDWLDDLGYSAREADIERLRGRVTQAATGFKSVEGHPISTRILASFVDELGITDKCECDQRDPFSYVPCYPCRNNIRAALTLLEASR